MARFNKVLLISVDYSNKAYATGETPEAGLGYIAETLAQNNVDYDVIDMSLGYTIEKLKNKIRIFSPDLIGIGFKSYRYKNSYDLINQIKKEFPEVNVVSGGAHILVFKEQALIDCPTIDYDIIKEGEDTIMELIDGKPLDKIKGLLYREKGKIIFTGYRQRIIDLNHRPFPKYEKFELDKYWYPARFIVSSRGCPHQCIFC